MKRYSLVQDFLAYVSAEDKTKTNVRYLVVPSQNVLIDRQRKVSVRGGYTRLGASNTAETAVRGSWTWRNSTGTARMLRIYDDELEVYLQSVDGDAIDAWTRVSDGLNTSNAVRATTWWDTGENLDLFLFVQSDDNIYEWGGGVARAASATSNTITKKGTNTFAQNRFYTTGDRTLINRRTGTEFTYTGGETTTTLTGVTPNPSSVVLAGDTLMQKIVTRANEPAADRNNDTIFSFENHVAIGSDDDNEVFLTQNDDITDTTFSTPRVAGEGALFTLDGPSRGMGSLGKELILFSGDFIYRAKFTEITVSTTLAEAISVDRVLTGQRQGSFSADTIVQLGNAIIYLSNEPALRFIQDPNQLEGIDPKTLSNPIKPDFDAEDFANAHAYWYRNAVYLSSPVNSRLYILEFVEDADGVLRRFWQSPQILPIRSFSELAGDLFVHSNGKPETYQLFNGNSDTASDDTKLPIHAIAAFAYNNYGDRVNLKNFDEYAIEGEITPSTDLTLTLNYNFGGHLQSIEKTIQGTDEDITEETLENASLGQQSLGQVPLGGALSAPSNTRKFRVIFEIAKEDFNEIQAVFSTNDTDKFWSILAHGANAQRSARQDITRKK